MLPDELKKILDRHKEWIEGRGGAPADLSGANLRDADLSGANLRYANLRSADLSGANLRDADLSGANLSGAYIRDANLRYADLSEANLVEANLVDADLVDADLIRADLSGANLSGADLRRANLSGAVGLPPSACWMRTNFSGSDLGIIVYKAIEGTTYRYSDMWPVPQPGAVLIENVSSGRSDQCACGVNFGTLEYVKAHYPHSVIWRCLIRWIDLADVVVPYNTDGKARCGRLELLEVVDVDGRAR